MSTTRLRGGAPARPAPYRDRRRAGAQPSRAGEAPDAAPRRSLLRRVLLILAIVLLSLLLLGGIAVW